MGCINGHGFGILDHAVFILASIGQVSVEGHLRNCVRFLIAVLVADANPLL